MKLNILGLFVLISCFASAQTLDKIIEKHIEAHGGTKNWAEIENMKITGQFTSFSKAQPFTQVKSKDGSYYMDYYMGKHKVFEAFNGKSGYTIDPWQEIDFPRAVNKNEINVMMQKADFPTPFFNYVSKGYKAEFIEETEVEGTKVYNIMLTRPNNQVENWYLSKETYLAVKVVSNWQDFTWPTPSEAYYDDYREVNGVILPFYTERSFGTRHRVWEIDMVEFNTQFDKTILEIPRSTEMQKLEFLEGKWKVKVSIMTRRGSWYPLDSTKSVIAFHEKNILTEHISYERMFPLNASMTYTYNSNTKKYRMTEYIDHGSNMQIFEGDFEGNKFVLSNENIKYGDYEDKVLNKFVFSNITVSGFIITIKESRDNGETWEDRDKLEYSKLLK